MSNYHNISELINENDAVVVLSLVQDGCKILSSAVSRLYYLDNNRWNLFETGVIVLVKNFNEKRYYIEFYDMNKGAKMFIEKIGKSLQYSVYDSHLHIIVSGSSCILLSLTDTMEGLQFSKAMNKLIETKTKKESPENIMFFNPLEKVQLPLCESKTIDKKEIMKRRFRHTKSDVGLPYNFRHIDHLGQNGFFLGDIEHDDLKNYLERIDMEFLIDNEEMEKPDQDHLLSSDTNFFYIKSKKFLKSKISKKDISNPENFIHVQHFGMTESNNFDLSDETSNMFSKEDSNTKDANNTKHMENKVGKMKISKSDISIPTNFRHVEHMGGTHIVYNVDENSDE